MHFVNVKSILSSKNGMNIYRGCTHGCIYCDARSTVYQMNHEFEDIEVKSNAPELLEYSLIHKRERCMIGTGSMCDPYMHCEKKLLMTRKCLEIIDRYNFGATVITKSDLVLRDLDLYKSINCKTKSVIQMTITTFDDKLCSIIEPNVCATSRRIQALNIFKKEGIPTVCWLTPILPFINDTEDNIKHIVRACGEAGVKGIIAFGIGLTLRDGDRQYFYRKLDEKFPGLKQKYISTYGNAYVLPVPDENRLIRVFYDECRKYNIETDNNKIFLYLSEFEDKTAGEQLTLF